MSGIGWELEGMWEGSWMVGMRELIEDGIQNEDGIQDDDGGLELVVKCK